VSHDLHGCYRINTRTAKIGGRATAQVMNMQACDTRTATGSIEGVMDPLHWPAAIQKHKIGIQSADLR